MSELIRGFLPSYGACIMGTGVVAIVLNNYWHPAAVGFTYLNTVLAVIVVSFMIAKVVLYPGTVLRELEDPILANFYPTTPIGLMVLASDYYFVLGLRSVGWVLWGVGAILTFALGVIVPFNLFRSEALKMEHINPSVFIPPVGLIVIPMLGGTLAAGAQPPLKDVLDFINVSSWGSGFFIYVALLAVCVNRFLLHRPLPSVLAPTMWINLGPIGAGSVSLYSMMTSFSAFNECMRNCLDAFIILFWGSGVWWLLMAITMTLHYIGKKGLPYAPSWWAFTFPLGAYTVATGLVQKLTSSQSVHYFSIFLTALLLTLWTAAFTGNIRKIVKREAPT